MSQMKPFLSLGVLAISTHSGFLIYKLSLISFSLWYVVPVCTFLQKLPKHILQSIHFATQERKEI